MSNTEAARIYESIIDDVIGESRQDFEDSGIDEATLQDLRTIWRQNLSATGVAGFSWDPSPLPDPSAEGLTQQQPLQSLKREEQSNSEGVFFPKDENGKLEKDLLKQKKRERTLASLDSDDINSDLDDSDDEDASDEDAEGEGMIILCLYEKVLRVKNKWKCNLKDGVANINGKDYAFAKATGESEWW